MEINVKHLLSITISLAVLTIVVTLSLCTNKECTKNTKSYGLIYAQSLNVLWVLFSVIIYIKYKQVKDMLSRFSMDNKKLLNRSAMQVGLAAAFGISVMANFQEGDEFYGHCCGTALVYGLGTIYQCIQTYLYVSLIKILGQRKRTTFRIILSLTSMGTFAAFFVYAIIAHKESGYDKEMYGIYRTISLVFQWISTASTLVYVTLFYWEFQKITLYEPDVFVQDRIKTDLNMGRTNEGFENT